MSQRVEKMFVDAAKMLSSKWLMFTYNWKWKFVKREFVNIGFEQFQLKEMFSPCLFVVRLLTELLSESYNVWFIMACLEGVNAPVWRIAAET